jgi:threonine/homoserine/homoserine lactone efflux protein
MTLESAMAFSLALLVWVLIPGPAILAIIGRSLTNGLASALLLIVGILLGDLFYLTIVLFGLAAVGKILGDLFYVIRLIGAFYLVILGLKLWLKDTEFKNDVPGKDKPDHYKIFLTGFSITLGNPKAILFHLGFLPAFFDLPAIGVPDAFCIMLIFLAVLGSSLTGYAYAASKARSFFDNKRKIRILNRGAGTILIGAGVTVAAKN